MSLPKKIWIIFRTIGAVFSILIAVLFVISAYCGIADPLSYAPLAVFGLCFPILFVVVIALIITWLCLRQWIIAGILAVFIIAAYDPIITFSPLNVFEGLSKEDEPRSFRVLSYNVMNFTDFSGEVHTPNRTIEYILNVDADFVCLAEAAQDGEFDKCEYVKDRIDDIKAKYPYYYNREGDVVLLSKFPFESAPDSISVNGRNKFQGFDVNVNGRHIKFIVCHLESIGLSDDDKYLYRQLTHLQKMRNMEDIEEVRETLMSKLAKAFRKRAIQAQVLRQCIDKTEGNIIVCGDFNDTPDSFAYRTIIGDDLTDAYKECAFGPTITFHSNRFFFRIDQVLYRGDFHAVDIERGHVDYSDHYPLITTFVWD